MKKRRSWKKAVVIGIALAMGVMPQAFAGSSVTIGADGVPADQQEDWLHNDGTDVYYGNGSYADTDTGYADEDSTYANGNTINVTGNESGYNILGGVFDDTHTTVGGTDTGIVTASGNTVTISGSTLGDVYGAYGRVDDTAITLSSDADTIDFHVIANSNTVTIEDNNGTGSIINGDVYGSHAQVSVGTMDITFATGDDASVDDTMEFAAIAGGAAGLTVVRDDSNESGITVTMTDESEDLGNAVNITNSTVTGSVFGGSAYIDGGAVGITNNSTDTDVNEKAALVAYANYNTVTLTDTSVGGDVVGGYAISSVESLTNNVPGGAVNDRDRDNLIANASNNSVSITGGSVTGTIYGGSAAALIEESGASEEYFLGSELYAHDNSISLEGLTVSGNVYGGFVDFYLPESGASEPGQIKVPAEVGGNSIAISGAADVSGANLYGTNISISYQQTSGVEYPYIVTAGSGNTLTLNGSWVDSGAATIGSIHNFDTINLQNLNYTFTNSGDNVTTETDSNGRVTAVTVNKDINITTADGMGSVSVTEYEFTPIVVGSTHEYPFSFISADSTPLAISAAAAADIGFELENGTDYTVKTNFNSTTNLNFTNFTIADYVVTYAYDDNGEIDYDSLSIVGPGYEEGATSVDSFSIADAISYNNFDTSAIDTDATYENIDTSNADGVRVHILGNIQAAAVTVSTDDYTAGDSRTYSYTLTGDITDSILTGSYTNADGETTATTGSTLILGSNITSSNAEIIAGAYNASGTATGGIVNIVGTFTPTGITYNNEDDVDSIYAGYSNGGSVTGNTVNLNADALNASDVPYNIFGYNSAGLENETDTDGNTLLAEDMHYTATSGSDNTLNINTSATVGDVGYFDTYTFAKQDSGFLTLNTNNFYGDGATISMNIDGQNYGTSDSITINGTHTGESTIKLINTNAEDLTDEVLGTKLVTVVVKEDGSFSSGGYQYEGALKWYDYSLDKVDTDNTSAEVANEDGTVVRTVTLDDDDNAQWYISGYATVEDEDTEPGPDEDNPDDDGDEGDKDTDPGPAEPPDDGDGGDGGPGPAQPTGNTTTVNTVIASNAVNYYAFRETDKLLRRMGELRNNGEDEQGIWIRVKGAKTGRDNSFENKYTHYEMGYDTLVKNDHREKRYEGFSLSYMDGSVKYSGISGSGKAHDEEIAFYRVDQYKHGHYLDLVTRIGMYSNRFGVYDTNQNKINGKNDTYGISMSAEYGRKKDYAHGWYIEPQGQLTIGYLSGNDYTTSNQVDVSNGCISSLVGRVGANFGKNFGREKKGIVYLKANWLHEFLGSYSIDMVSNAGNRVHAHGDYRDNWFEYGLGVAYKYTKNNFVYADIERTAGSDYYKNWAWNVGFRWTFN